MDHCSNTTARNIPKTPNINTYCQFPRACTTQHQICVLQWGMLNAYSPWHWKRCVKLLSADPQCIHHNCSSVNTIPQLRIKRFSIWQVYICLAFHVIHINCLSKAQCACARNVCLFLLLWRGSLHILSCWNTKPIFTGVRFSLAPPLWYAPGGLIAMIKLLWLTPPGRTTTTEHYD